mgnify:CR=1 FL=1
MTPKDTQIVSMVTFNKTLIVATTHAVYKLTPKGHFTSVAALSPDTGELELT